LSSLLWCPLRLRLDSHLLCMGVHVLFMLFTYTGAQHDFYVKWFSCRLKVTRWVSYMVQELITLPEHLNSPSVFSRVRVARYCFMYNLLQIVVFPFGHCVVRPSSIVMPVLWCMASDYLFGIFNFLATVLSVPWCTASDCHFGSFNIVSTVLSVRLRRVLITPLVSKHSTIVLSFLLRFTISDYLWYLQRLSIALSLLLSLMASDYSFGIFKLLTIDWHGDICPSVIYDFWLQFW